MVNRKIYWGEVIGWVFGIAFLLLVIWSYYREYTIEKECKSRLEYGYQLLEASTIKQICDCACEDIIDITDNNPAEAGYLLNEIKSGNVDFDDTSFWEQIGDRDYNKFLCIKNALNKAGYSIKEFQEM